MHVRTLRLEKFGVFEAAKFDFSAGINVLIGRNSTGKSHVLKLLYTICRSGEDGFAGSDSLAHKLGAVFKPDRAKVGRLVRRGRGRKKAEIALAMHGGGSVSMKITTLSNVTYSIKAWRGGTRSLFLPTRDVLAMYEGFIAAYKNREISFDETYYDTCVALNALPLRGTKQLLATDMMARLERAAGGSVSLIGERFYSNQAAGKIEAHLVAEGFRKLATLTHLIANGSLEEGGILFWDEPEASLNPRLIKQVVEVLLALADKGVQIFIASHDYLLTQRLSLATEETRVKPQTRFFCLSREKRGGPVSVEAADNLSEVQNNPILAEFSRYYEDQRKVFHRTVAP
jgi:ABC-type hemin transport system ATPase subunit